MSTAVIGLALTAVSTAFGMYSSIAAGNAAAAQAEYQAEIAKRNQQIAEDNAARAINRSQIEAQDQDATTAALLGEQVALQGASGLDIGGRSFMLTRKSARELGRKDALNVRQAGEVEAYNFRTDAMNFGAKAQMARMEGENAQLQGYLGAGQSLITGATKVAKSSLFQPKGLLT